MAVGGAREKKPLVGHWDLAAAVAECEPNASRHGARNWWRGWKGPSCRVTKATKLWPRSWDERHRVLVRLSGSRCTGVLSTACPRPRGLWMDGWIAADSGPKKGNRLSREKFGPRIESHRPSHSRYDVSEARSRKLQQGRRQKLKSLAFELAWP